VLRVSRRAAAVIMDNGQSAHYEEAAQWLERARAVWYALGCADEWREHRAALLETHRRKYKLLPLLRALPD
jgi:uncharacterized Zn finger protein